MIVKLTVSYSSQNILGIYDIYTSGHKKVEITVIDLIIPTGNTKEIGKHMYQR
jgi:hypothetical protein